MSSTADSFNATGSVVTFETLHNNNQAFGVSVTGRQSGVYGESSHNPVGTRPPISVVPIGTGVAGLGDSCGVQGSSDKIGVLGQGGKNGTGVYGVSSDGTGIEGFSFSGDGVIGKSQSKGRGGVFESGDLAQVQLVPHARQTSFPDPVETPVKVIPVKDGPALPKNGRGGDLLALMDKNKQCTLWFCVKDGDDATAAQWTQVLLSQPFDGRIP